MNNNASRSRGRVWLWLLLLPFFGVLWVPFYNRLEPSLFGFPFFYWYQFAWVIVTALLTAWAYLRTAPRDEAAGGRS
ncbi:DUF3311 domain-containing protein [Pandoraea pnomenusa]|uniref:DUF3311 domain-containing protein n=1 Tax=Pandoraea pnomenusa TaxID=93220 RepID=UPI001198C546|nr:DUF3311 domain-containing protein [Pandoraea pnomenusa]QDX22615.1 DUF3311 domain-containing protein [Pandoraea pnomenusa]